MRRARREIGSTTDAMQGEQRASLRPAARCTGASDAEPRSRHDCGRAPLAPSPRPPPCSPRPRPCSLCRHPAPLASTLLHLQGEQRVRKGSNVQCDRPRGDAGSASDAVQGEQRVRKGSNVRCDRPRGDAGSASDAVQGEQRASLWRCALQGCIRSRKRGLVVATAAGAPVAPLPSRTLLVAAGEPVAAGRPFAAGEPVSRSWRSVAAATRLPSASPPGPAVASSRARRRPGRRRPVRR